MTDPLNQRIAKLEAELAYYHDIFAWMRNIDMHDCVAWSRQADGSWLACLIVNDVFWWGTADTEVINPEDIPALHHATDDLMALGDFAEVYAPELFAARKRGDASPATVGT